MKTTYLIIVILAAALVIMAVKLVSADNKKDNDMTEIPVIEGDGALSAIMTRTSVRDYTDAKPDSAQIDTLLRAAMAAPTARDSRPWRFIVVTQRQTLDSIAANCHNIGMAAKAQLAIVVCGDLEVAKAKDVEGFWVQDCSAATENLLIAAHAMGLGAVWCGIYPVEERVEFISGLLGLPAHIIPLNVIPVGVPVTHKNPKDKYDPTRITHDRFDDMP